MTEKPEWQDWPEEPWRIVDEGEDRKIANAGGRVFRYTDVHDHVSAREVACVNACAGVRDPEARRAAVERVVEAARRTRDAYRDGVTVDIMRAIRGPLVLALAELDRLEQGDG